MTIEDIMNQYEIDANRPVQMPRPTLADYALGATEAVIHVIGWCAFILLLVGLFGVR